MRAGSVRVAPGLVLLVLLVGACASHPMQAAQARLPSTTTSVMPTTPRTSAARAPTVIRRSVFGYSRQGRELVAFRVGPTDARRRILVVGVIHGNEAAGRTIAEDLLRTAPLANTEVVVVPDLNPDGVARGTRQNEDGVDLNRNFPYRWRRLGHRGDQQYSGTGPLSEPESRAMVELISHLRPTLSVWFHQPVDVVDESGGSVAVERRFARIIGLPLRRLQRYPGSAAGWENTSYPGTTAFIVELPKRVSPELGRRALAALRDLEN